MKTIRNKARACVQGMSDPVLCHIVELIENNHIVYKWWSKARKRWNYCIDSHAGFVTSIKIARAADEYEKSRK